jgi:hypothetical protein
MKDRDPIRNPQAQIANAPPLRLCVLSAWASPSPFLIPY